MQELSDGGKIRILLVLGGIHIECYERSTSFLCVVAECLSERQRRGERKAAPRFGIAMAERANRVLRRR